MNLRIEAVYINSKTVSLVFKRFVFTMVFRHKHVEKSLHKACIKVLQLMDLTKDDNVTPELMIKCCERLIEYRNELQYLNGTHVNITTYYSVLSDGVICIPWNWKI